MAKIRELPPELIDQIAAGEVVERPASVLKELVENALDAGSRRIEVEVEGGGVRLLRISDDGEGIAPEDIPLAVRSHATSKLRTSEDLFAIASLGFRGEALASIASVSRLRLASRQRGAELGAELRVDGGRASEVRSAGGPVGTTVEVADLFFNVPARRAFLRTERAELRNVLGELRKLALARTDVSFRCICEGRAVLEAPAEDEPRLRVAQVLGRELSDELIAVPIARDGATGVRGYVSPCDRSRGDSHQQYFFLNGRAIRDSTLLAAVRQGYDNLLPPRRHPSVLLWLDLPVDEVDVNVHPQKTQVRFRRDRDVFHLVVRAVRAALGEYGLSAELRLSRRVGEVGGGLAPAPAPGIEAPAGLPRAEEGEPRPAAASAPGPALFLPFAAEPGAGDPGRPFLQLHRRYVVEETEQGLRIVDPHALHERILYEEIRARLGREPLESQRFLFPQVIEVDPLELMRLGERGAALAALGFELDTFGERAIAVHAAPRLLRAERVRDALLGVLGDDVDRDPSEDDADEGPVPGPGEQVLHDLAATLACRAAVRFGDPLPPGQLRDLLARRALVPRGHCCPHGRPTALALTLDELDRRFGRQDALARGAAAGSGGPASPAGRFS